MSDIYCGLCMTNKPSNKFKIWFEDKSKARACDCCKSGLNQDKFINKLDEVKLKNDESNAKLTPAQKNYGKTEKAKKARETRRSIDDFHDLFKIKEFTGSTI